MGSLSIVVPAHNEERVLRRCLKGLLEGSGPGEVEVVVACNGCTDRTAEIARGFGPSVRVVETTSASKALGLRLGDAAASHFPRFYVDADVEVGIDSLREVARALEKSGACVASPRLEVDTTAASAWVRAYYAIWTRLPYHRDGLIGSGIYAVSEAGRRRFDTFPDVISDDGFIRLSFQPHERVGVANASFRITAPMRLADLVRIKIRSQKGWIQLKRRFPNLVANDARSYGGALGELVLQPSLWWALPVYAAIQSYARAIGWWLNSRGRLDVWERDDSSRNALPAANRDEG